MHETKKQREARRERRRSRHGSRHLRAAREGRYLIRRMLIPHPAWCMLPRLSPHSVDHHRSNYRQHCHYLSLQEMEELS